MRGKGKEKVKNCEYCGKQFKCKSTIAKYCSNECRGLAGRYKKKTEDTICWDCKRAVGGGGCSWADKLIPGEGWKATETILKNHKEYMHSYKVHECPLFIEG